MYLFYFIQSKFELINKNPRGGSIPHVKPTLFWNLLVPLPPLPIQKKIVQKLDDILGQLEEKKKQILLSKEKKDQAISQLSQKTIGGIIINQLKRLGCSYDWSRETFTMNDKYYNM